MKQAIWHPPAARIDRANMQRFIRLVNHVHQTNLTSYSELYDWSIRYKAEFWLLLWQFSDVIAEGDNSISLQNAHPMIACRWFPNTKLNYAENLLCHKKPQQTALIFHNEIGHHAQLSYLQLYCQVSQLALALRAQGIKKGDRVAGVLPNIPETVIAMLAVSSLGAIWSSCSPDFGVSGIIDRFGQIQAKLIFIGDGYYFNGKCYDRSKLILPLLQQLPTVKKAVLVPYINANPTTTHEKLVIWRNFVADLPDHQPIEFTRVAFSAPLFILYSSGTTGPPKCIVHSVGGTLLQHIKEQQLHVDIHPGDPLFYYTTCGWMMWNWLVSGLASAATLVLYDGAAMHPSEILIDLIDRYQIKFFGVAAKYIDALQKLKLTPRQSHKLTSLTTILSTGSPLMPEAYDYIYHSFKQDVCLASISGGTDIISCFVLGSPLLPVYRGEIQCRGLAMDVQVFDEHGDSITGCRGELVCTSAFPSMPLGFWNDQENKKFIASYFKKYPGIWSQGDFAELTANGGIIIYGRSDSTLNPGGVRIGTAEIYRQVEQLSEIQESLVVGMPKQNDCIIILFVKLRQGKQLDATLDSKIKQHIRRNASPRHVPSAIYQISDIPRTRNGKIMELAVRDILLSKPLINREAVTNPEVLTEFEAIALALQKSFKN